MAALTASVLATQLACGTDDPTSATKPVDITAMSPTTLSGTVGVAIASRPSVKVTASDGSGVAGVIVTFAVASGGGSVTGGTQATNESGIATVGSWTLGPSAGTNTLTATASGLTSVTFTATSSAAPTLALSVTPAITATAPNATTTFAARNQSGVAQAVIWQVNGIPGGTAALGFISGAGVYTAPATIPAGDSIVVTAVLQADETRRSAATVFFVPDLTTRDYYVALPRAVHATRVEHTRFLLVPPAAAASVNYVPLTGGGSIPFTPIGNGVFTLVLDHATAVAGHQAGTLHNTTARLDYRDAAGAQIKLTGISINVRDASMPDVAVTALGADAQRSPHVLNLRTDAVTTSASSAIVSRAIQALGGDQFDFVAVIATVTTNNNRNYVGLRNDIRGIGLSVFDFSAPWGGAGRLRGVINYPIDAYFDGAEQAMMHEIGHSWINYGKDAVLGPAVPHWPPSTMALGTMGFNIPGSQAGGTFPWSLVPLGDGTVRIDRVSPSDRYTPLDLYVMGLLPPDSVPPMYVLPASANPNTFVDGMVSPARTYTINDYIAGHGVREPSSAAAPRTYALAVVVLTYGRLLTPAEMAFFDAAAARAETTVALRSTTGLATGDASGFFLATGGRATLRTRLP